MVREDEALPAFVLVSRIVLALMGLLMVVMPWSERYSMLDNFPHGQDTEVGLLVLLMSVGLALLFAWSRNTAIRAWLVIASAFVGVLSLCGPPGFSAAQVPGLSGPASPRVSGSPPGAFDLPLQI